MTRQTRVHLFVALVALSSVLALVIAWPGRGTFPGSWGFFILTLAGCLLESSRTKLRSGDATGSLTFIVALVAIALFGGFWGGCVVGAATVIGQLLWRNKPIKVLFNTSQQTLSAVLAWGLYLGLGGSSLPKVLLHPGAVEFMHALAILFAFLAGAVAYFIINSILVSAVVALSSGESARRIWSSNTVWVLGYDMAAGSLSLLFASLYLWFDQQPGVLRLGFVVVMLSLYGMHHIYAKLHDLRRLYDELDTAYERLELNVREQLEMMVKSIEARDPYTSGHSRRVAALSKAIATDLGLEAALVDEIENAALLHDVGKIHAEFAPLLSKEGRLTEEEWEIMKTHAAKSAELVSLFSRFRGNVLDSVRWHHERWDGKGYPDGIAAEKIPLGSRIIMISDTIDAMSTDRPYRKALSFEKVVSELIKYRGIQFDPDLVDSTVNSVTVRRMVSDKEFLAEQITASKGTPRGIGRPALRSQSSFWEGLRASVGQQP